MVNESKKLIDKVLSYIVTIRYLCYVTLSEILEECGLKENNMTMH